jgi:hypothetical protein
VASGVYDGIIKFNGSSHWMYSSDSVPMGTPRVTLVCKMNNPALVGSGFRMYFEMGTDSLAVAGSFGWMLTEGGQTQLTMGNIAGGKAKVYGAPNNASASQYTAFFDRAKTGTDEILFTKDGLAGTGTVVASGEQTGNFVSNTLQVGCRAGPTLFSAIHIDTLAIYTADVASDIADIEDIVA